MKISKILIAMLATFAMSSASAGYRGHGYKKHNCPDGGSQSEDCGTAEGTIDVFGEVTECLDLTVLDTVAEVDFDNLGKQIVSNQKVGQFAVDSNSAEGFSLTFSSSSQGELIKVGSAGNASQRISYLVDLSQSGGVLGAGTVAPASTSGLSLASPITLDFAGTAAEPTVDLTYDVNLSLEEKVLEPGIYSDTITIQLAAL